MKPHNWRDCAGWRRKSSPAFCGGLIEARSDLEGDALLALVFPRVLRGPH